MPEFLFALLLLVRKCVRVLCVGQRIPKKTVSHERISFCDLHFTTELNEDRERKVRVGPMGDHKYWMLWRGGSSR